MFAAVDKKLATELAKYSTTEYWQSTYRSLKSSAGLSASEATKATNEAITSIKTTLISDCKSYKMVLKTLLDRTADVGSNKTKDQIPTK